jgi:lipopolysaccharide export system protein LptA
VLFEVSGTPIFKIRILNGDNTSSQMYRVNISTFISALFFILGSQQVLAQKKVLIKSADQGKYQSARIAGEDKNILTGNVVFEHDGALMYCDSAWFFSETNSLRAFSNVRINQGDTLFLYSDRLNYNGNTKLAEMNGNVRLVDDSIRLFTSTLFFDRNRSVAFYPKKGRIEDGETTLTSKVGTYYSETKWYHFRGDVVVVNPEYRIDCDTMHYHTERKIARFLGPTTITGDSSDIYCENGFYNTLTDIAQFNKNALIRDRNTFLKGDSIYYEQKRGFGQAFENVMIYDTTEHYTIRGQYGEYLREPEYAFVTGHPTYSVLSDGDSLHIYGDTLFSRTVDSTQSKMLQIWPRVRFFKEDLQGKCDSLVYLEKDSAFYLFRDPVIWNDSTQLTGKHIIITMADGKTDSLKIYSDAFILTKEDFDFHHQVKGRDMYAKFVENQIHRVLVKGNGQSLYVIREDNDEENPPYVGVNISECSEILIRFEDGEIDNIKYIKQVKEKTYPIRNVTDSQLKLEGFYPRFDERPATRWDIYPKSFWKTREKPI